MNGKELADKNSTGYDYYYQQRLKYKDSEWLNKHIEFSKIWDQYKSDWEKPCYDPETMLFTVHISTPYSFQGKSDFESFDFVFFPEHNFNAPLGFLETIFSGCVHEGIRQKSNALARFVRNL